MNTNVKRIYLSILSYHYKSEDKGFILDKHYCVIFRDKEGYKEHIHIDKYESRY